MIRDVGFTRRKAVLAAVFVVGVVGCSSSGSSTPRVGNDAIGSIKLVASTSADSAPADAAPAPDGSVIYYTATSGAGGAVFRVPAGGGTATTVSSGAPLAKPVGLAVATDGSQVFVADGQAGAVFSVPANGGSATEVAGTEGRSPEGLDVAVANGHDVIYFTGTDPANGSSGLFSIPASGGTATVVAEGAPLVSADGVVVAGGGVEYVTDRGSAANQGAVFRISGSSVTKIAGVDLGTPGGVSITKDGSTLLVSSQNAASGADQVLTVNLASGKTGAVTKVVGANHNSSGGLHRAFGTARFAWADVSRSGRIYRVDP